MSPKRREKSAACCCALALICALVFFGISRSAGADPALTVVHVNGVATDDITPFQYALETGMFRKAGLDAQFDVAKDGAATVSAVVSDSYQIGKSSLLSLMNAHLHGISIVVIAAGGVNDARQPPFAQLVVAPDSKVKSGKDLTGATIAVGGLNDLSTVATDAWIDKTGGDSRTVHFVEMPVSTMPAAVADHRVDAAFILQPVLANALTAHQVRAVGTPYTAIAPIFLGSGWFTTREYATQHPDIVAAFARTMYKAAIYTNTHTADTAPMMSALTKVPMNVYSTMPRTLTATATELNYIQPLIDTAARYHAIPQGFSAQDFVWPSL